MKEIKIPYADGYKVLELEESLVKAVLIPELHKKSDPDNLLSKKLWRSYRI